jgi:phage-related baseplate assembly protein
VNLYGLPDIVFAGKDPATIKQEIIGGYEQAYREATGEKITLYPGDPRRLFLLTVADMIILQRNLIDWTGKQNLLAFAGGASLDHLGLLLGVTRLPAQRARTTIRFTLSAPQPSATVIPKGTRLTPGGGNIYFATREALEIPADALSGDVLALAAETGAAANGYMPGQISRLVDPLPWIASVENVTESAGGADIEDDENLRERIHLAPESFAAAGPHGAYIFWAKSAHQDITDVAVIGPPRIAPGQVEIYPLMKGGIMPTQDILDLVYETCSAEDIRPMTDFVSVLPPAEARYRLSLTYWIERSNATLATDIASAVGRAVTEWAAWQRSKIGRDLTPSKLVQLVMEAGAKRVSIRSPAFTELSYKEIGVIDGPPEIIYGGLEDD